MTLTRPLALLIALAFVSLSQAGSQKLGAIERVELGEIIYGDKSGMEAAKGKPTVLYYWDMTCLPCMANMKQTAKFAAEVNRSGGVFISVHHGRDLKKQTIKDYATKRKLPFSIALGGKGPGIIRALPKVYVFNAAGDLVYQGAQGKAAMNIFRQQVKAR